MRRPRLTDKDWRTIRSALNHAMDERDSFADAYSYQGPEAEGAMKAVHEFEALHRKLFGDKSARQQHNEAFANMPTVPALSLMAGKRND